MMTMMTGNRDRGNGLALTEEAAAGVDWKRFHRVVSGRDDAGRHRYEMPAREASMIDWRKFHRVAGPRDDLTGRRSWLFRIPSQVEERD